MKPYEALNETEWSQVDSIHDLLDEGEIEAARAALASLLRRRPGQPDLLIVDATLCLEEGEPTLAIEALRGAERSADPARFFYLRAAARYELVRFEDALADAERAIAVHEEFGIAWDLVSRIHEHLGNDEGARKAAEQARIIDSEAFPAPLVVTDAEFDALVVKSLAELPKPIRDKLQELPIIVEALPARAMLTAEDPPLTPDLLGLFVGRHIFAQTATETPSAPGAIYLFRRNLLRSCADREELALEVRITVQHEVGHLMGLDEDDLEQWGLG